MRFGTLEFRPRLGTSLITLLLLAMLIGLGFWQLDRAGQKRELLAGYNAEPNTAAIRLESGRDSYEDFAYHLATAAGQYDRLHQFLLDNRTHNGRAGYHVLTPLQLRGGDVGVLVNRGWIPLGQSRSELPDPRPEAGARTVLGRIKLPVTDGFMLGEEQPRAGWPYRIQRVDTARLAEELGYALLPVVLLLDPEEPEGFVRDWHPLRFGPERNLGYAVQWFGLAAALLIIYLVVNTRRLN
ncbi:MAG: SURF1 family protein [Gammaproteobacteria bacterium]|jgi:surfeit locus 1 family protein